MSSVPLVQNVEIVAGVFQENGPPLIVTSSVTLLDSDSTHLSGASIRIDQNFIRGQDILSCAGTATITASYDATRGLLTLNGQDTVENYQQILRTVRFQNLSDDPRRTLPDTYARRFRIQVRDESRASLPAYRQIIVVPANDAPVISGMNPSSLHPIGIRATGVFPTIVLKDVDSKLLSGAQVQIATNYHTGSDFLTFAGTPKILASFDSQSGTLTLSGIDTVAAYQAAVRKITYQNRLNTEVILPRVLTLTVQDEALVSNTANRVIYTISADSLFQTFRREGLVSVSRLVRNSSEEERSRFFEQTTDQLLHAAADLALIVRAATSSTLTPDQHTRATALSEAIEASRGVLLAIRTQMQQPLTNSVITQQDRLDQSLDLWIADASVDAGFTGDTIADIQSMDRSLAEPWNLSQTTGARAVAELQTRHQQLMLSTASLGRLLQAYETPVTAQQASISLRSRYLTATLSNAHRQWEAERQRVLAAARIGVDLMPQIAAAPRLSVSMEDGGFFSKTLRVRIRSPYEQTWIEIEDRTGRHSDLEMISIPLAHPGGTSDTIWSTTFERRTNVPGGEFYVRMYQDASKQVLLGMVTGYYSPDSNQGSVEAQAPWEDLGSSARIALNDLGGFARIQSWQGPLVGIPSLQLHGGVLESHGAAFSMDLRDSVQLVNHVRFQVQSDNPGLPIPVRFYRGTTLIGSMEVESGEVADYFDAGGITSIVVANAFRPLSPRAQDFLEYFYTSDGQFWQQYEAQHGGSNGAANRFFYNHPEIPLADRQTIVSEALQGPLPYTMAISQIEVSGTSLVLSEPVAPLSLGNNADLALAAHPDWHQSDDTLRRGPSPGYLALGRFSPNAYGVRRDLQKYSAVEFVGLNGPVVPTNVARHVAGGDVPLDRVYWEILGNTVILKPGAPEQCVIYFGTPDGQDPQGRNIDVSHRQSVTLDDLLPPAGMSVTQEILAIRNVNVAEWIGDAVTEVLDLGRPVTISQGNVLMNVLNRGLSGGTVRLITSPDTPGSHEVSFYLGPHQKKGVSIRFAVPVDGQLKIRIVLPDGTLVDGGKTLKTQGEASERRIAIKQSDGTYQLRWVPLNSPLPTVSVAPDFHPGFVSWKQAQIAKGNVAYGDPENSEQAFLAYLEQQRRDNRTPLHEESVALQETIDRLIQQGLHQAIRAKLLSPVNLHSPSRWYVQEGSPDHAGNSLHALDLNQRGSAENDRGEPVLAMAAGMVVYASAAEGRVLIRSEVCNQPDGLPYAFYQEYVHLQNICEGLVGTNITAGTPIGEVGRVTSSVENPITSHLHVNVMTLGESVDIRTVVRGTWNLQLEPAHESLREIGGPAVSWTTNQLEVVEQLRALWEIRRETQQLLSDTRSAFAGIHNEIDKGAKVAGAINILFSTANGVYSLAESLKTFVPQEIATITHEEVWDMLELILEPVVSGLELVLPESAADELSEWHTAYNLVRVWETRAAVGMAPVIGAALFAGEAIQNLIVTTLEYWVDQYSARSTSAIEDSLRRIDASIQEKQIQLLGH